MAVMFHKLQELMDIYLREGTFPSNIDVSSFPHHAYRRLVKTLHEPGIGSRDRAGLLRHILRRETELQGGQPQYLNVPRGQAWPDADQWKQAGVKVMRSAPGNYLIRAEPWSPGWFNEGRVVFPEKDIYADSVRVNYEGVKGDPFLSLLGRGNYRSVAQRDSMRSVLTAPPGSTLVLNLPTGSGKSLCFQAPALLKTYQEGVTVIVVPTTSLALDQERAMEDYLEGEPAAYYSDPSTTQQEINSTIRKNLKRGTQRLLFTSPESLRGPLISSLYETAYQGYLKMLVIDEAHIVDQWGDEFRPEFQMLAGIRNDLLKVCSGRDAFNTVLLSATVTGPCLDTLETLYGKPGPFEILSAVQLRPEPSYWVLRCNSEEEKQEKVLETLNHVPRPVLLYVTKVDDANKWFTYLKKYGYLRCDHMTGKSRNDDRRQVIKNWREENLDLVVATSAFGLGVDQANVRTVIHACVPENVDRFYQEVGRGGRDGLASLSMLFFTPGDIGTAKGIGRKIITVEKGIKRWKRMFRAAEKLQDNRLRIPIDIAPGLGKREIDMDSSLNEAWNIRTLTLMARSRLIELDSLLPPRLDPAKENENEDEMWEKYCRHMDDYRKHRAIRLLDNNHLQEETWDTRVEIERKRSYSSRFRGMKLMEEIVAGKRCFSDIFKEIYTIPSNPENKRRGTSVIPACGGCPACRRENKESYANPFPRLPLPNWKPFYQLEERVRSIMRDNLFLAVFYHREDLLPGILGDDPLIRIARWLVNGGFINLVVEDLDLWSRVEKGLQNFTSTFVFHYASYKPLEMLPVPTAVLWSDDKPVTPSFLKKIMSDRQDYPRILLICKKTLDPTRLNVSLESTLNCFKMDFKELLAEVDS